MTSERVIEALRALAERSPWGALLALAIIAGVVALVLLARARSMFDDSALAKKRAEFEAALMDELASLRERETSLRAELEDSRAANARLTEALGQVRVEVALLREQSRRVIELMRDVRDGKVAPAAISLPNLDATT